MTDTNVQIPPVPPECDLRDFGYIPLEFGRLFKSDTWVLGTPEEKVAALHLWCASWHEKPSASLPDDDRMLAHLSATGQRWKKLRNHALRGWVKCSDGRLYHPVVAEKANIAWREKLSHRARTHNARVAAVRKKLDVATGHDRDLLQAQLDALLREPLLPVTATKGKGEVKGEGEGQGLNPHSAAAPRRQPGEGVTVPTWNAYCPAYKTRYSVEPVRNKAINAMLSRLVERLGAEEAPQVAAFYLTHNRADYVRSKHPVNLLLRDAEGLRTEWATGRRVTDAEARQADQTAARGNQADRLIEKHAPAERKVA